MKSKLNTIAKPIFIVVVVALILRAIVLFLIVPAKSDLFPDGYGDIAWNIVNGYGYTLVPDASSATMFRTPGYILFLVPIFFAFGKEILAVQAAQYLVSIGSAYLIYKLASKITNVRSIGIISSIIFLLSPATILADNRAMIESFLTFCVVAFLLLLYKALETNLLRHWLYAGLAFGWILLIRSSAALFPLFLAFLMYRQEAVQNISSLLKNIVLRFSVFCFATGIVLSPWVIRNYAVSGEFEPTMTVRGAALFHGVYLLKSGETEENEQVSFAKVSAMLDQMAQQMQVPYKPGFLPYFYNVGDEVKYYRGLGDLAVKSIRSDPVILAEMIVNNASRFWFKGVIPGVSYIYFVANAPLLILAGFGTVLALRARMNIMPALIFSISYYISYLPVLAFARYSIPTLPYLAIASAIVVHRVLLKYFGSDPFRSMMPNR